MTPLDPKIVSSLSQDNIVIDDFIIESVSSIESYKTSINLSKIVFDNYQKIKDFLNYIDTKIKLISMRSTYYKLDELDFQCLSKSHRQNSDMALSLQLREELGYNQKKANEVAHTSCKSIVTYLQLKVLGVLNLGPYSQYYKENVSNGNIRESDAYMNVTTADLVKSYKIEDKDIIVNQIDNYQDFINCKEIYGQVRMGVGQGKDAYTHSMVSYNIDEIGRKIADVSYREQGKKAEELVSKEAFRYFLYLS